MKAPRLEKGKATRVHGPSIERLFPDKLRSDFPGPSLSCRGNNAKIARRPDSIVPRIDGYKLAKLKNAVFQCLYYTYVAAEKNDGGWCRVEGKGGTEDRADRYSGEPFVPRRGRSGVRALSQPADTGNDDNDDNGDNDEYDERWGPSPYNGQVVNGFSVCRLSLARSRERSIAKSSAVSFEHVPYLRAVPVVAPVLDCCFLRKPGHPPALRCATYAVLCYLLEITLRGISSGSDKITEQKKGWRRGKKGMKENK